MLIPALIALLANVSSYMYPPVLRSPLLQATLPPLTRTSSFFQIPSPPQCSLIPTSPEGELVSSGLNVSLLCRTLPDMSTSNQSFTVTQQSFVPSESVWNPVQALGQNQPFNPNLGSALLKWALAPNGKAWALIQQSSSAGSTGNGGSTTLWYFPGDPFGPPAVPITDSSKGSTFLDLQLTQQGLYGLVRRSPVLGPGPGPGPTLIENGLVFWPMTALPERPQDTFSWLLGTNSSRMISSFFVPSEGAVAAALYIAPQGTPVVVEQWRQDVTSGMWSRVTTISVTSQLNPPTQMTGFSGGLVLMGQKTLSILTLNAGGAWSDIPFSQLPGTLPLQYRSISPGFIWLTPTSTPSSSEAGTTTASATSSSSGSSTATATSSSSGSSTTTASPSASSVSTTLSFLSPSFIPVPTYTSLPTQQLPISSVSPRPQITSTATATVTATQSQSSSNTNATPPFSPPSENSQANSLSFQEKLGLGFGLTSFFVVLGFLLACFARQTMFNTTLWIKRHILRQSTKPKRRHPTRMSAVAQPAVVHLSMNPALVQQQSALELLQMAREQRLEAIQAQKDQIFADGAGLDRMKNFKKVYKPMMGTSV